MSRKADPSSRRSPRRRPPPVLPEETSRSPRKNSIQADAALDSDFGLALALAPALRRRSDA